MRLGTRLEEVYQILLAHHGPQYWWPAQTPFEVMIGAVLTQNTAWTNVERALESLRQITELTPSALLSLPRQQLAQAIRPCGYFNLKTQRLRQLCHFLEAHSDLEQWDDGVLRERLLEVKGIGPETADDILLYAFHRPVFVIDAYTRRLFGRLGLLDAGLGYEIMRRQLQQGMSANTAIYQEYHALIVNQAKTICRKTPRCSVCPLEQQCDYAATT
ncbi:MAG: endonuclease III domain-containing protein [Candidatus Thiodiazotropha sp.]